MRSADEETRFCAIQLCRKTLSRAKNPPIDEFYNRGAVDILVDAVDSKSDSLVFEATWALTNIASGESKHTTAVVESGAIPKFIMLLSHPAINVAEQSVWALGNIAGDGAKCRDLVIGAGVLNPLFKLLERVWDMPSVVSNIAWVLSNLCRNRDPPPPIDIIRAMLPVFKRLLQYDQSREVVVDTAWALSYASDAVNDAIDDILASGCLPLLLRLLSSNLPNLVSPALRAVGNLVIGDDAQTQAVIDAGLLPYIPALLHNGKSSIVKETCWMVSNLTAGSVCQIQAVIDHNLIPAVLEIMHQGEFRTQKEACWVINNMVNGGSAEQCAYLLNQRVIPALSNLLTAPEAKVITMVLEIIKRLFEISEQYGHLEGACIELETCGGVDKLEKLQDHGNDYVYKAAYNLLDLYFNDAVRLELLMPSFAHFSGLRAG
ncbi:Importin subunit alpha [Fasciolopsis buskii]|uniref:Importin subunit alpha n=1 Tax=Fasciolopsis buskii TaxID=27845 RepID=A0A8E0RW47_9TREM|nr:Importin subunit alpha [Fasciolopsis buski]